MKFPLTVTLILFSTVLFAQSDTTYFDAVWTETTKAKAVYYRPPAIEIKKRVYTLNDYYMASGKIQMQGYRKSPSTDIYHGYFTWYDEEGNKEHEGQYRNGSRVGKHLYFYEGTDKVEYEAKYCNANMLHGWKTRYYRNGNLKRREKYLHSRLIKGSCYTQDGKDTTFFPYSVGAEYPGGTGEFLSFICQGRNEEERHLETIVIAISETGSVAMITFGDNVSEKRRAHYRDRIFEAEKWTPARVDGKSTQTSMTFILNN